MMMVMMMMMGERKRMMMRMMRGKEERLMMELRLILRWKNQRRRGRRCRRLIGQRVRQSRPVRKRRVGSENDAAG